MIKFMKTNRIFFIAAAIVLIAGACLTLILISNANSAMAQEQIKTAVAEASESATPPVQTPAVLSSKALGEIISDKETRRDYVIPSLGGYITYEAKTWKKIEPDNFTDIKVKAVEKAAQISKALFSHDIDINDNKIEYYTDTDKDRKDIIKVITSDDAIVCTLAAETFDLIEIDYYFVPEAPYSYSERDKTEQQESDNSRLPNASDMKIADRVAAYFGTSVKGTSPKSCSSLSELLYEVFDVTLTNGKFLKLATLNGELYAAAVYPTEACMGEAVYFEADVQWDQSIIKKAYPRDFKLDQPGDGDMTKDEAKKMFMSFLNLANGASNYTDPDMTFYIDNSGKRENYWHIESNNMKMDIASKSKFIISVDCILWNPQCDLTDVQKVGLGGSMYTDYVHNILTAVYGDRVSFIQNNAIDGDNDSCTEYATMTDGTVYEFMFERGKLNMVEYYPNEESFRSAQSGWKADHIYINTVTHKEFIPE